MADESGMSGFKFDEKGLKEMISQNKDLRSAFNMIPWMPAMFMALFTLAGTLVIQMIYYAATGWDRPVTNGQMLTTLAISLVLAIAAGGLMRVVAGRKFRSKMKEKGIM
jgi:hypothetical protein